MDLKQEIKTNFRNEYQKARLNIHFTFNYLSLKSDKVFKKYKLSATQYNVLRILRGQHSNAVSIGLIKERMLDKNSDVSRIVDRLTLKNLIKRNECKLDRRQKDVKITSLGLDLLAKLDQYEEELDKELFNLSLDEVKQLNTLLDKIRD